MKQFQWERVKTIISAFGLGATAIAAAGLFFTYLNTQKEQQLNTERLITDRFTKAVEQLGHQDIAVRIGGIYALERITKDSPKDHWTVMEILTAFVRERSFLQSSDVVGKQSPPITSDVQSALTVICRGDVTKNFKGIQSFASFLSGANLRSAVIFNADLKNFSFVNSNLQKASITRTDLQEAILHGANLQGAIFVEVNLKGARFDNDKQLEQAIFCRTTMPNGIINNRDCKKFKDFTN